MIKWEPGELITDISIPVATGIPEKTVWRVVSRGVIQVIECENKHFQSYISVGVTYNLIERGDSQSLQLWEIDFGDEEGSQFLLYDWKDSGPPSMEIDF